MTIQLAAAALSTGPRRHVNTQVLPGEQPGLPGDRGSPLNYGVTIVASGLASWLLLGAALPTNYVPGAAPRAARAAKVQQLLKEGKTLERRGASTVEASSLSALEKEEAVALGAAPFLVAPFLLGAPIFLKAYDVARTGDILADSADAGRKYSKKASESLNRGFFGRK